MLIIGCNFGIRSEGRLLKTVLTIAYYDGLGVPGSYDLNFSNRPGWTRMSGGVAGAQLI